MDRATSSPTSTCRALASALSQAASAALTAAPVHFAPVSSCSREANSS